MVTNKKVVAGSAGLVLAGAALLATITSHEGTRYKTYRDIVGMPTVCEGITGQGVLLGKTYTRAECDALLTERVQMAGKGVLSCVHAPLNQHQYDAFADLAYNIGVGGFCKSSIAAQANAGRYTDACNRIMLYDKAGGAVVQGLVNRRKQERDLCLKPINSGGKS